jgi:hypothetical protein
MLTADPFNDPPADAGASRRLTVAAALLTASLGRRDNGGGHEAPPDYSV